MLAYQDTAQLGEPFGRIVEGVKDPHPIVDGEREDLDLVAQRPLEDTCSRLVDVLPDELRVHWNPPRASSGRSYVRVARKGLGDERRSRTRRAGLWRPFPSPLWGGDGAGPA